MKKTLIAIAVTSAVGIFGPQAMAADNLAKFDGGIGVIPVSNVAVVDGVTTVTRNTVRGVNSAGQIWVIRDLRANVKVDGSIRVDGRGLLFGGGNNVGLQTGQSVFATLLCANDGNIQHNSTLAGVPLDANGDFRIDDVLQPSVPSFCDSPVLLIRNAGNLVWFAAGIPKF